MIHPIATIPAGTAVQESHPLDRDAAALFLRAQASWLRRGLRLADNAVEVGVVLSTHDHSHESWVELIAAVDRGAGERAAAVVSALYGFHGRVAGSLERRMDLRLDAEVQRQVRRMLAEQLTAMTEDAIATLAERQRETYL